MKKFVVLAGLLAIGLAAFAAEVTVDEEVQVQAAKDSFKDGVYLNRLRSNTTVNIAGEHYDFMYNGRVNAHDNWQNSYWNLVPGGDSDANLNLFWKYAGFGIGTDLGGKFTTPAQSMWDDDLYGVNCDHSGLAFSIGGVPSGKTGVKVVKDSFGGNGWNGDAYRPMSKGLYAQVTPIDAFRFAVCVPFQDFKEGWTKKDFRLGLYTEYNHDLFSVGLAYDTTFDNSKKGNVWNLALGAKTKLDPALVFNAEVFASILAEAHEDTNAVNWGIRVPLNFEDKGIGLGVTPGFEMIIYNNQAIEYEKYPYDDVKPATLVMLPVSYKINDVASVGLDLAWTTDCLDYICGHRFLVGPNCAFNTSVGKFNIKFNAIIDKDDEEKKDGTVINYGHDGDAGFGFRLDLGYKVNLK